MTMAMVDLSPFVFNQTRFWTLGYSGFFNHYK